MSAWDWLQKVQSLETTDTLSQNSTTNKKPRLYKTGSKKKKKNASVWITNFSIGTCHKGAIFFLSLGVEKYPDHEFTIKGTDWQAWHPVAVSEEVQIPPQSQQFQSGPCRQEDWFLPVICGLFCKNAKLRRQSKNIPAFNITFPFLLYSSFIHAEWTITFDSVA